MITTTQDTKQKILHRIQCMREFIGPIEDRIEYVTNHYATCCDSSSSSSSSSTSSSSSSSSSISSSSSSSTSSDSSSSSNSSSSSSACDSCDDYEIILLQVIDSIVMQTGNYNAVKVAAPDGFTGDCWFEASPVWLEDQEFHDYSGPLYIEVGPPDGNNNIIRLWADEGSGLEVIAGGSDPTVECFNEIFGVEYPNELVTFELNVT